MRRSSIIRWSIVALAMLSAGCGTTRKSGPLGWAGIGPAKPATIAQRNPLRQEADAAVRHAGAEISRTAAVANLAGEDAEPIPESMALLERELWDATPEERREFAELATAPPDLVEQILRARRLRIQREQDAAAIARGPETGPSPARPLDRAPVPGEPGELRISGGSGLGNASPWSRGNPAILDPHLQHLDEPDSSAAARRYDLNDAFGHSTSYGAAGRPGGHDLSREEHGPRGGASRPGQPPHEEFPRFATRDVEPWAGGATATDSPPHAAGMQPRSVEPQGRVPLANVDPTAADGGVPPLEQFGPLPDPHAENAEVELQRLIAQAEARVAGASPGTTDAERGEFIRRHVHLRLLYLIAGQQGRALVAIPNIEPADQEFWMQTLWALNNYFDEAGIPDRQDRAGQTVAQLRTAIRKLQEQARLDLRNVVFCHKISSFGNYERFDRDEFGAGQPVLVYAEVANFTSETTSDGMYRTMLKSTIEVYKAGRDGELIEQLTFPATEDLCRNHRQDYFHSYEFTIPPRASLGPHVLKLTVEDQLSRKLATYTVNFTVR